VCGVYGNLTGVWFSKRTKDFAPGECSFTAYEGAREARGGKRVMTVMAILKHNILQNERARCRWVT